MGDDVNAAQIARFNAFFDEHYTGMLAEVAKSDPSGALRRTRAGFASAYQFWGKVEDDGDPVGWVRRVIADDRRNTRHAVGRDPVDDLGHVVEASTERRRIVALARRQRAVATVVLGAGGLVFIGAELFVAHR